MIELVYTCHAETRIQQRGIRNGDIPFILACATQIDDDTWLLCRADTKRVIERRKRETRTLERLKRKNLVVRDGHVVTVYASRPEDQKRTLRRGKRKGLLK